MKKIFSLFFGFIILSMLFPHQARAVVTQYWDDPEDQFRVGDSADQGRFMGSNGEIHLRRETGNPTLRLLGIGTDHNPYLAFDRVGGTYANPTRTLANMLMGNIVVTGWDGVNSGVLHGAQIKFYATEDWTTNGIGSKIQFLTTANGSTSQTINMEMEDRRVKIPGEIVFATPSASQRTTGNVFRLPSGDEFVFGEVGYIDSQGEMRRANSGSLTTVNHAFVATTSMSDGEIGEFLSHGVVQDDTYDLTRGLPVYLASVSGQITQEDPQGAVLQRLGVALTQDSYFFDPQSVVGEIGQLPSDPIVLDTATALATVGSSLTMPVTIGSGENRMLLVTVAAQTSRTISSVTYNGSAMTEIASQSLGGTSFDSMKTYMFLSPDVGTHNISISLNSSGFIWAYGWATRNTLQSTPTVHTCLQTSGASLSCGVTTQDGSWLMGVAQDATSNTIFSAGTDTLVRIAHPSNWGVLLDSNGSVLSGNRSLEVSIPSSNRFGMNVVAIQPAE